jgi:hypothetical protein
MLLLDKNSQKIGYQLGGRFESYNVRKTEWRNGIQR